ncbi:MAG: glutaminase A [Brachybacterium sp.]|nr:glutaminase A [Brachybacterium sp.]
MTALDSYLTRLREDILATEPAGEIEALARLSGARADHFGVALCSSEGIVTTVGTKHAFPIQSISKSFAYAAAIDLHGKDYVVDRVDEEPTGEEFNAISLEPGTNRPKNPLVNIGALRIHAMLGKSRFERTERLHTSMEDAAGRTLERHSETIAEEVAASDRNLALAYMLRAAGSMDVDPQDVVAGYIDGCATLVTTEDLAVMAGTLANGGTNPVTGKNVFSRVAVRQTLSVMMTCGMYDSAGDWVTDVGLPGKSGVAGGIIAALPGSFGIATYAPHLDGHGNSVRGILAFEHMAEDFTLHVLDGIPARDLEERASQIVDS